MRRPEKADLLERIARDGRDGFYTGAVAEGIIEDLIAGGSTVTMEDFANFEPRWRRPLRGTFGRFTIFTAAPPLSGLEVLQSLALMEAAGIEERGLPTEDGRALEILVDSIRAARADRYRYLGDPEDGDVPVHALLDPEYIAQRSETISRGAVPARLRAGGLSSFDDAPSGGDQVSPLRDPSGDDDGGETTHLAVVDKEGNAVSLTYTMGGFFGSSAYARGISLNSIGKNFSAQPKANRSGPYRTPRMDSSGPCRNVIDANEGDILGGLGALGGGNHPDVAAQNCGKCLISIMDLSSGC